jgi:hypothetical protein
MAAGQRRETDMIFNGRTELLRLRADLGKSPSYMRISEEI